MCQFIDTCNFKRPKKDYLFYCINNPKICIRYQDLTKGEELIPREWRNKIIVEEERLTK